jgi:TatD DNase family protein
MKYIDTHAHIHFDEFKDSLSAVFANAHQAGIETIVTVGTDDADSRSALQFVLDNEVQKIAGPIKLFATAGIHPHEASLGGDAFLSIKELAQNEDYQKVLVGIGECGLDYFKNLSSKAEQRSMLEWQLELATECNLPVVFHVRDAWDDFFAIIKNTPNLRGVIHSFTGDTSVVERASNYDLYFGLNGIMTFTKDQAQLAAVKAMSAGKIMFETDCPFLAPVPMRGKQNEPSYLPYTAEFVAKLRDEALQAVALQAAKNSQKLFKLEI